MSNKKKTEKSSALYLIDGSAYIHRAYHAIRGLTSSKGFPTGAIMGFTRMLIKLIEDENPGYIAMFFDSKGPTFRHSLYPAYKENRPPMPDDLIVQIEPIKKITRGFKIPIFEIPGYEADDLIGSYAKIAESRGWETVIVSGDKDFMQLVSEKITLFDPMKDKRTDKKAVYEAFQLEPHQLIEVMALSGDSADNVPGVPGIGPKTAVDLIQKFESLKNIYESIDSIPKKKVKENLINNKDQAFLSRSLVLIDTHIDLSFEEDIFCLNPPDATILSPVFKEFEFRQLSQWLAKDENINNKKYSAITTEDGLMDLCRRLKTAGRFAIDTETTSLNPIDASLVGISIAIEPHEAFYIPIGHVNEDKNTQLELEVVKKHLMPILSDPSIEKIGQNIKYDWRILEHCGFSMEGISFDTMIASYLIDPSKRAHSLDQIALDFLNHKTITYEEVTGKGKNAINFSEVSLEKAVPYACEDADITLMAARLLEEELKKNDLIELFKTVEMPLIRVLKEMEDIGFSVDKTCLEELSKNFESELQVIEETIYSLAGNQFNIKSSQQLGAVLFETLNLPVQKKTRKKTGYSTDVDVLTALSVHHELPAQVLRHRTLSKLKSTYVDALLDLIHPSTHRIHSSFNQTVAATGRLSSSDPNLQNIPIRTEEGQRIRSAFIPKEGWSLISADYSQIELRILAHYADDPSLIQAFREDRDIHTQTALEVFNIFPSFLTPELRRQAKAINFGIIYGMSPYGLSQSLGISQSMAKTYIDNYFSRYKGVKRFIDETIEFARTHHYTTTLLGRKRALSDINTSNRTVRQFAERMAINTPIQGTAADLIKVAMIELQKRMHKEGFESVMLLSVHDELLFETPPEELLPLKSIIREIMESIWNLKVPLKVNISSGKNWAEVH